MLHALCLLQSKNLGVRSQEQVVEVQGAGYKVHGMISYSMLYALCIPQSEIRNPHSAICNLQSQIPKLGPGGEYRVDGRFAQGGRLVDVDLAQTVSA